MIASIELTAISPSPRSFLRFATLDGGAFERLNRYETAVWRQVGQFLITLDMLRCR